MYELRFQDAFGVFLVGAPSSKNLSLQCKNNIEVSLVVEFRSLV